MALYFTSDTHLGHAAVIRHDSAPFPDIDTRDQFILDRHNDLIGQQDDLYHLGDVAMTADKLFWYLGKANGRIHLIRGNHDDKIAWKHRELFASAHEAHYLRAENKRIYLSHYAHRTWRNSHHGSYHLYGHSHGCLPNFGRSMDVGVKPMNYSPISLAEVILRLDKQPETPHHP